MEAIKALNTQLTWNSLIILGSKHPPPQQIQYNKICFFLIIIILSYQVQFFKRVLRPFTYIGSKKDLKDFQTRFDVSTQSSFFMIFMIGSEAFKTF